MKGNIKRYRRYLTFMAGLGGLLYGVDIGVIAAALPYIEVTGNYSTAQTGMIVGMVLWGSVVSSLITGQLCEWFGRKKIIILAALCFVASIPIICFSGVTDGGNFEILAFGRILQGVSAGIVGVVVPMYLAECLAAEQRGSGTAMFQLILTLGLVCCAVIGLVVAYLVGTAVKPDPGQTISPETLQKWTIAWQFMFLVSVIPGLMLFFGAFKLKESPRWLYKKGREDDAFKALLANNTEKEAKRILEQLKEDRAEQVKQLDKVRNSSVKESLLKKKYILPFLLTITVLVLTQATGVNTVLSYSVKIFQQAGLQGEFANWSDLLIKLVNFFMTLLAVYLVDRKGRKFLLRLGTGMIVIGQLGVAISFLMISTGAIAQSMTSGIIITCFFFFFIAGFAVGPGVCVWLCLSELMPTRIRANGMAIGMILNQAASATIASIFPTWAAAANMEGVFFVLAGCTLVYFLIATFILPETKGKTLEEISKIFE